MAIPIANTAPAGDHNAARRHARAADCPACRRAHRSNRGTRFHLSAAVANGDVRVATPYGSFTCHVTKTPIVTPDDLSVMALTSEPTLTLVTCYPFSHVGHAPKRFILEAVRSRTTSAATN
jgi:LPXTG-site transpeptidase (sortase) family protein